MKSIKKSRVEYKKGTLNENDLYDHPVKMFKKWLENALTKVSEPNAFILSTVNQDNAPSSRVLLLRDINDAGFVFFTNYLSQKGCDISENPKVCMNFFWPELEQQIGITGHIEKVSETISDDYFQSRPYESRIGAWSSPQSECIDNRQLLENKVSYFTKKYSQQVPRPPHWGGYVVMPNKIEFWQGRANRLHDRILYSKDNEGSWLINRLAP